LAHLFVPEDPLPAQFPALLFGYTGHPNDGQFVLLSLEVTRQTQAQRPRIQSIILAAAFSVQTDWTDDQVAGAGRHQLIMQGVAKTATFVHRPDRVAGTDFLLHPLAQAWYGETHSGFGVLVVGLNRDGDLLEVDIQAQFEHRLRIAIGWILCCVVHAMFGLMVVIDLTLNGVLVRHTLVNPSWHLTATAHSDSTKP